MEEMSSYDMTLQKRKKLLITGRSDRDMYINEKKQLGKKGLWILSRSQRDIVWVIKKLNENQYQQCGNDKRRREESRKVEIGITENIFMGKDDTIRSIRTRTGKSITEQPIQQLNPTELHCHSKTTTSNIQDNKTLNVNAEEYRPKKSGAAVAK